MSDSELYATEDAMRSRARHERSASSAERVALGACGGLTPSRKRGVRRSSMHVAASCL